MFRAKLSAAIFAFAFVGLLTLGAVRNLEAQQTNPGVQQSGAVTAGHAVKWGPGVGQISDGGGVGVVSSVFGRVGAVVAAIGDYTFAQISGTIALTQLPTVNANVGAFGGVNSIPSFTVNAQGLITAAAANFPAILFTELTGSATCAQLPALTGDATSAAGSCAVTVVKVNGVSYAASPSVDTLPVITAANTTVYTSMPNCVTGSLHYATATHLFSCASSGAVTPTTQFLLGSGNYTPTVGTVWSEVTITGAGGGGGGTGASSPTAGGTGGTTNFGTFTAIGGAGGALGTGSYAAGGTGGAGTAQRSPGQNGDSADTISTTGTFGGEGGGSGGALGYGGRSVKTTATAGRAAQGCGGGGGGASGDLLTYGPSGGGGGGETAYFIVNAPGVTAYVVGAAGAAGTGTNAGGAGTVGCLTVVDHQ